MARLTASQLAAVLANKAKVASSTVRVVASAPTIERVLAIDPALRNTGWSVLERDGRDLKAIAYGVISNPAKLLHSGCLVAIREQLNDVIREHKPTVCAIEATIFVQSF
jgi:crossover junction endodeoxyribonuclease RuvC